MKIRTYYWHDRIVYPWVLRLLNILGRSPYRYFLVGNAGDLVARNVIEYQYRCQAVNCSKGGKRLLVVGSIGNRVLDGDIVCGIGVKTHQVPSARDVRLLVRAVRGPLSYDVFKQAGHDVSDVRFQLDPGLLIRFMTLEQESETPPRGVGFIPHYRERGQYLNNLPNGMRMIDIDNQPAEVARQILSTEMIYSSSLHGVIFAHALRRPCVLVAPQTEEPMLKYQDYFASIDMAMPKPLDDVFSARFVGAPTSAAEVHYELSDFVWPDIAELQDRGIAVG